MIHSDFSILVNTTDSFSDCWNPVWELSYTLEKIIGWHMAWLDKEDMQAECLTEIEEYTRDMNK
jgi:hypothetical protein